MFTTYEFTQALVADRQSALRREARHRRLARLVRSGRRNPRPVTGPAD